ncbi:MAG: Mur ligase [Phycisphaerae bacterium]|nr:Mur ligase [Phycisphaerae bacterium]
MRKRFFKPAKQRMQIQLGGFYRGLLEIAGRPCFIGITGSCGKTTTAELLVAILSQQGRTQQGIGANTTDYIARTILRAAPWHRFCVSEVSAHKMGVMAKSAALLRPHIAVLTNIGGDHYGEFRGVEATVAEKVKLVRALSADGTAVLNADDPNVYAMRERTEARVITYGLSEGAMVRGENVSCAWPRRLSIDVCHEGQRVHIQTWLLGEHWAYAILAAVAAAVAAGVSLERAAKAIGTASPIASRMSEHATPDGVTFIRDDFKAPLWTVPACMDVLRHAQARRKIIAIGSISDTPKSHSERQRAIIRQAIEVADKVVFVGNYSRSALKARSGPDDDRIMAFPTLHEFDAFLRDYLQAGDMVLLKGSRRSDHFDRIVLSRTNDIACWRHACQRDRFCHACAHRYTAAGPADAMPVC